MTIKLAPGSLNYWTTDSEFGPVNDRDPNPALISGEMRPMTDAEITVYLDQQSKLYDYDD